MIHPVEDVMKKERPIFRRADESPDDAIHSPAPGQRVPILLLLVATLGLAYEAILLFTSFLAPRSEEHTSELQSRGHLVCRLLLEKKKTPSMPSSSRTDRVVAAPFVITS